MSSRSWRVVMLSAILLSGHAIAEGGLFEKNHPLVEKGNQAYAAGKYDEALSAYDEAQKVLPSTPEIEFNRGDALAKLGKTNEAKEAFLKAAQAPSAQLRAKAQYNLGNLYAQSNPPLREEALRAYRKALLINPKDEDARHNLQTLLQNKPPEPPKPDGGSPDAGPQDGGSPDAGTPDGGSPDSGSPDGGSSPDGGGNDGGTRDGGPSDGGTSQQGADGGTRDAGVQDGGDSQQSRSTQGADGGTGDAGSQAEEDGGQKGPPDGGGSVDGGMAEQEQASDGGVQLQMSREEALRLLDSMKQNEKSLQRWKFQKKRPRKPNEKDW